jgi:tetraacyldisaccharide 4'-kinase
LKRPWALPLVPLYAAGAALRWVGVTPKRLAWPVISVGSLSAGGAGKTPFVIALAQLLKRDGFYVDVLSRGYGRVGTAVERVDPEGDAQRFGDEPLLIAREAGVPVFVGAQRFEAGRLAEQEGETGVHLLDDGFQHRLLARDADIALVSSDDLADWLLPAGNLRERKSALQRADVLAVPTGDDSVVGRLRAMGLEQPVWRFLREMVVPKVERPVYAFCGIARPEQFFSGLERAGMTLVAKKAFRDHYQYQASDVQTLEQFADRMGAGGGLVTTAKDRVRMGSLGERLAQTTPVYTAGLRVMLEDEAEVAAWLKLRLQR